MTYRSSPNQIANLKRKEPKGKAVRDNSLNAKVTSQCKAVLVENLKAQKMTVADLLEAIGEKLEQGGTLDDILKN
ncbi:MAG: hypothetical protein ACKPH7_07595 [Planktothrix sp.]|uniref:hypothetical protein n=1 Tax=Planktothrix sp. TaxID=3088171 RepID=UPI0038D36869